MKKILVKNDKFIDQNGREAILRGINMVCKEKEQNFLGNYQEKDFLNLKELGFNVIRLGVFWKAIEPEPGIYDEEYLDEIELYVKRAQKHGMNIFIDMHQDLFADSFSDGAPDWAIINEENHVATDLWSESYLLSKAVQTCFDDFFANKEVANGIGLMDHYLKMWENILKRFNKYDNVIGYDFMNEPFIGTDVDHLLGKLMETLAVVLNETDPDKIQELWFDPSKKEELMGILSNPESFEQLVRNAQDIPRAFEALKLMPFYEKCMDLIEAYDPSAIIFMEANYFANMGMKSAVKKVDRKVNQCYSPHGYDILVDTELYNIFDPSRIELIFATHDEVARGTMPTLVGEWGCFPEALDPHLEQAKVITGIFEKMLASDTYFDFEHLYGNRIVEVLKRAYPVAIAGQVKSYHYDFEKMEFTMNIGNCKNEASIIYVPNADKLKEIIGVNEYQIEFIGESNNAYVHFTPQQKEMRVAFKLTGGE